MRTKPDLKTSVLWNISAGFFGVQIAYALQSANISRIFATLGADPHNLSYFWILPPLMGMIVQPLVGYCSDKTWMGRLGRRIPYLLAGALVAVLVMCLLPNAGSLGLTVASAMTFGLVALMFLDTSINMAMQPFKMMVGDMVNERQKAKAYSIQSFLCNAGSLVGYVFPYLFAAIGIANVAAAGEIPDSVKWSFYIGAAILILCVIYTTMHVREYTPAEMQEFQQAALAKTTADDSAPVVTPEAKRAHQQHALAVFFQVGLVQFFCWAAFLYMWTYSNGTLAYNCWGGVTNTASKAYQDAGNWVGVVFAVQACGSILWALVIPKFKKIKTAYVASLLIGAAGFVSLLFVHDKFVACASYFLIGAAWAAMLALPFTLLTNALQGSPHIGSYLGLFNCTICLSLICSWEF